MDNLRLLGIGRMDMAPNALIRKLCRVKKGLDERIDEGVLQWFGHVKRMEKDRIAKKSLCRRARCSRSVGRPQKRWINTLEFLKKRGLEVMKARRMVQDRSE